LGQEVGRTRVLGGNYKFFDKKATVAVGYITMENPYLQGAANTDFTLVTVTGKYEFTKDFNIAGGWYKLSDEINDSNSARQLSLTAIYNLSKHTEVYAGWAQMANEGSFGLAPLAQGHLGLNSLSTAYPSKVMNPGQTHDAIMAGMMIRF
jgi:predicted porin